MTRIARCLVIALLLLAGPIAGPASAAPASVLPFNDPGSWLVQINEQFRARHDISPDRNVATFQYTDPKDNRTYYITTASVRAQGPEPKVAVFNVMDDRGNRVKLPDGRGNMVEDIRVENETLRLPDGSYKRESVSGKHSETLLDSELGKMRVPTDNVSKIYTNREPCLSPGNRCGADIVPFYRNAEVSWTVPRGGSDREFQQAAKEFLRDAPAQTARFEEAKLNRQLFRDRDGTAGGGGALPAALAGGPGATGGIDFTSLQLRYLADPPPGDAQGLRYAFSARSGGGAQNAGAGRTAALQSSDAFFVWLSLTPDTFWVNLNPTEPDRVVDPRLGTTDAGRILLEADLLMKKTAGQLIHPDTPLGKQFWQQLRSSGDQKCLSFRQWIVPAPATVQQDEQSLTILDAPLTVKLESEYLQGKGAQGAASCPAPDNSIEAYNEQVLRTLILPRVEKAVNTAPEYAELRQVYLSRVAAEWYRQRSARQPTNYRDLIGRNDVRAWPARTGWQPRTVFDRYVDSYRKGEFTATQQQQEGRTIVTRTYVYGGVDLARVPFRSVDAAAVQQRWGNVTGATNASLSRPSTDGRGNTWLGASTGALPGRTAPYLPVTTPRAGPSALWGLVPAIGGVAVMVVVARRRSRRERTGPTVTPSPSCDRSEYSGTRSN